MVIDFKSVICLEQNGVGGMAYKEGGEKSLGQWKHIQGYIRLTKLTELKIMHFIVCKR